MKTHFILKPYNKELLTQYLRLFDEKKRKSFKLDKDDQFILLEIHTDNFGNEKFTKIHTITTSSELYTLVKDNVVYDYSGIVYPIMHVKQKIYSFEDYNRLPKFNDPIIK